MASSPLTHFDMLEDPRRHSSVTYPMNEIVTIAICATISGADKWTQIEQYGKSKEGWLRTFLKLEDGIPSHDTFRTFFMAMSPRSFLDCFTQWTAEIASLLELQKGVVAIDGKALRGAKEKDGKSHLHIVNAWASDLGILLGQIAVDEKSNEITAIPQLLDLLDTKGAFVTIDAIGCQKDIAEKIIECEADYLLAVKANQPTLHRDIVEAFEECEDGEYTGSDTYAVTDEMNRGRHEKRECHVIYDPGLSTKDAWAGLVAIVMVVCTCVRKGKTSKERRYYISSRRADAMQMLLSTRHHWSVENSLHWSLDVNFREDESPHYAGNSGENLSLMRKLALSLLGNHRSRIDGKGKGPGLASRRLRAAWDNDFVGDVLEIKAFPHA